MVVSDLRLLGSAESRLAFACTATHLASAFTYRPAALLAQQRVQAAAAHKQQQQQLDLQEATAEQLMAGGADPSARHFGGKAASLGPSLGRSWNQGGFIHL